MNQQHNEEKQYVATNWKEKQQQKLLIDHETKDQAEMKKTRKKYGLKDKTNTK